MSPRVNDAVFKRQAETLVQPTAARQSEDYQ